jgi:hypothetical protein
MAYIPKRIGEQELKEHLSPEAFDLVVAYFKENPRKTTLKINLSDGRVVIRKVRNHVGLAHRDLYTLSVL